MKNLIFGTDWWTDCDDAVALRIISRYVKAGSVKLLGVGINACMAYSAASLKGFLLAEGIDNIPIGIDLEATDFGGNPPYQQRLAQQFCPNMKNEDAMDAVRLYRKLLAEATEPVDIAEVGFFQVIAGVLQSKGDDISPKTGVELFREKVRKVWAMAGKWDEDGGREHNFCRNARSRAAAQVFCELCPVPVTFLGFEIGLNVISGGELDHNDHLYRVLEDHGSPNGRHSWDPMLVYLALIGDEEAAGYTAVTGTATVDAETGANHFVIDPNGFHKYVVKNYDNAYYSDRINEIIKSMK